MHSSRVYDTGVGLWHMNLIAILYQEITRMGRPLVRLKGLSSSLFTGAGNLNLVRHPVARFYSEHVAVLIGNLKLRAFALTKYSKGEVFHPMLFGFTLLIAVQDLLFDESADPVAGGSAGKFIACCLDADPVDQGIQQHSEIVFSVAY